MVVVLATRCQSCFEKIGIHHHCFSSLEQGENLVITSQQGCFVLVSAILTEILLKSTFVKPKQLKSCYIN